ncbi:MAG: type II toxin-antitoxin system Phd/YefM family antitoxin [Anaerolineae bacterium]
MESELQITQARQRLANLVDRVRHQGKGYIILRHGKPAAALVPVEVYESWLSERRQLFEVIRQVQEANRDADPDEVLRDVLQAQQAIRQSDTA